MLNKNRIKKVLYIDHTNLNATPIKRTIDYKGHKIEIYAIGHGTLAGPVFNETSLDLIIEDKHDTPIGKLAIKLLKETYHFRGHHKGVSLDDNYIINKNNRLTDEELEFLKSLVKSITILYKKSKMNFIDRDDVTSF